MTTSVIPGLDNPPTTHGELIAWVTEVAELTTPERVECATGRRRSGPG